MPIAALRVARVLLALLMMMVAVGARAEDPPQLEQHGPAASAPTGERGSSTARGRRRRSYHAQVELAA